PCGHGARRWAYQHDALDDNRALSHRSRDGVRKMSRVVLNRRKFLTASVAGAAGLTLAGCDQFDSMLRPGHPVRDTMASANELTYSVQRALLGREALAREFSESEIRQGMRPNGSTDPNSPEYLFLARNNFFHYRLEVDGLVEAPKSYSLAEL